MLGTGLYVDDIDYHVQQIDAEAQAHIQGTLVSVFIVSVICIVVVSGAGLALNISNHREATERLRELARKVVSSQEEERLHLARELHDGISQVLVSAKLLLETTILTSDSSAPPTLERALDRLNQALREVRGISHNLRPAALDDLGLAVALKSMTSELSQEGGPRIEFASNVMAVKLTQNAGTALFRICQEALTNARLHSEATRIDVSLNVARRSVTLAIEDNGKGFNMEKRNRERRGGTGLRNMRERVTALGGELLVRSGLHGTQIVAILPIEQDASAPEPEASADAPTFPAHGGASVPT
jgi:two-component system NarL family sensor kinase